MKAIVRSIRKLDDGYEFIVYVGEKPKVFKFADDVKAGDIIRAIRDWLRGLEEKASKTAAFNEQFLNQEITL